jgi:GlpG protein
LRLIGTLPKTVDAQSFVDHLLALGMKSRIDERPDACDLWIYNEDHVQSARDELTQFLNHPDHPRYQESARAAKEVREKERKLHREFQKNFRDAGDLWYPTARRRIVTLGTTVICVFLFLLQETSPEKNVLVHDALLISSLSIDQDFRPIDHGLDDIRHGQVWRLVTPILLHGSFLHLVVNMLLLNQLGSLIELRRGHIRLLAIMLISAVASNLGQFFWMDHVNPGGLHLFLGMSGVISALFGYIWMKGLYEPEQGMILSPNTVIFMLAWLFFCLTGYVGPIANAAHFVGLASGMILGLCRF